MIWLNYIQTTNDMLTKDMGFTADPLSAARMATEVGELIDVVMKLSGNKRIKSTDNTDNLLEQLEGEIADVLVYLGQVASFYNIDMERAFINKTNAIRNRRFK